MSINGVYAGLLAVAEVGLGGALHAARAPMRGQLLSLNQIFILSKASIDEKENTSRLNPLKISCVAAILKTVTPMGNKLTPMIAITMQGLLFSIGTLLFGHTLLGRIVGASLSSLWAFIQPLLLYSAILGIDMFNSSVIPLKYMLYVVAGFVFLKVGLAIALAVSAASIPSLWFEKYVKKTGTFLPQTTLHPSRPLKGALRELIRPVFLFLVLLSGAVAFVITGSAMQSLLAICRPLAIGFVLFFIMRSLPLENIILWIRKKNWGKLAASLEEAIKVLQSYTPSD